MFALAGIEVFEGISLKVDPEEGASMKEQYEAVQPAYHMNKKHWVTVRMDGGLPDKLVKQWIDRSYGLVVAGLPKSSKSALDDL